MIPDLLTEEAANDWCSRMKNADETTGPYWSKEKVQEIMEEYKIDEDPNEFYAVLNAIYSLYCEALRKHKISQMAVYVDLAKAWLKDENALPGKAFRYYSSILSHE